MRRCQTSRQHWISHLQPHLDRFFQRKNQKPHLEIVGSLIFCVGLTFSKPAWSAPEVGSAALSLSNSEKQGTVEVTDAATEADIVVSPSVLPPGTMEDAITEWSPPVNRDDKGDSSRVLPFQPTTSDRRGRGEREQGAGEQALPSCCGAERNMGSEQRPSRTPKLGRSASFIQVSPLLPSPLLPCLRSDHTPEEHRKNLSTQTQDREQPLTSELRVLELPPQLSLFPPCSATQQQCSSTSPSLVADAEKVPTPELQPFPIPNENSLPSEQSASDEDPELGKLRLRELAAPPPPSQPAVYLLGGAGYFRSNNIFSGVDPVDDGLFKAGLTLLAVPSIGPETSLFASVGGNIYRYSDLSVYNYDELNFSAGIRQKIGSRTYGELGWNNRQLFSEDGGDRFLDDHSVYLELGRRDVLARQLTLDTFYQFRVSFANPSDRSQIINYLGTSLGYTPIPPLEVALGYQFAFSDFTQKERQDTYHQVIASLSYTLTPNSRLYLYGGHSFGNSSDKFTDFEGLVFGAGINWSLPLF